MIRISSFLFIALFVAACGPVQQQPETPAQNKNIAEGGGGQQSNGTPKETEGMTAATACYSVDVGDKAVLKSQTFAINFEPFKGSCFVTTHDREYTDPPLGAEIAIYKDGKKVKAFYKGELDTIHVEGKDTGRGADRFSSETFPATCWVEAVAFQDLSADGLTDVILVVKCGAKNGPYQDNRIYFNNSKYLITRDEANAEVSELQTIKQIVDYAKQNPRSFSLIVDAANSNSQP